MMTEPDEYSIFSRDNAYYTLKRTRCGSIEEILMHAPLSMLHHWDLIQPKDDIDDNEMHSMPLLFTSSESYIRSFF